jgi:hypothetical protein
VSAPHGNRGRILCAPINPTSGLLTIGFPATLEPLAMVYDTTPRVPHGVLVRVRRTGTLAVWTGQAIRSVPPRKAQAALDAMEAAE